MPRCVLLAPEHFHAQTQPRIGHKVTVIAVARPSRFMRIVPHLRSLLVTIDRLDRYIDVQDPGLVQHRLDARAQFSAQPGQAFILFIRFIARRTTSSLTVVLMPSNPGLRVSPRTALM